MAVNELETIMAYDSAFLQSYRNVVWLHDVWSLPNECLPALRPQRGALRWESSNSRWRICSSDNEGGRRRYQYVERDNLKCRHAFRLEHRPVATAPAFMSRRSFTSSVQDPNLW